MVHTHARGRVIGAGVPKSRCHANDARPAAAHLLAGLIHSCAARLSCDSKRHLLSASCFRVKPLPAPCFAIPRPEGRCSLSALLHKQHKCELARIARLGACGSPCVGLLELQRKHRGPNWELRVVSSFCSKDLDFVCTESNKIASSSPFRENKRENAFWLDGGSS